MFSCHYVLGVFGHLMARSAVGGNGLSCSDQFVQVPWLAGAMENVSGMVRGIACFNCYRSTWLRILGGRFLFWLAGESLRAWNCAMPCPPADRHFRFSSMVAKGHGLAPLSAAGCAEELIAKSCVCRNLCDVGRLLRFAGVCWQDSGWRFQLCENRWPFFLPVLAFGYAALSAVIVRCNSCWGRKILRPDGVRVTFRSRYGVSGLLKLMVSTMIGAFLGVLLPLSYAGLHSGERAIETPATGSIVMGGNADFLSELPGRDTFIQHSTRSVDARWLAAAGVFASTKHNGLGWHDHLRETHSSGGPDTDFFRAIIVTALIRVLRLFRRTQLRPWVWLKCSDYVSSGGIVVGTRCLTLRP